MVAVAVADFVAVAEATDLHADAAAGLLVAGRP